MQLVVIEHPPTPHQQEGNDCHRKRWDGHIRARGGGGGMGLQGDSKGRDEIVRGGMG